MYIKPEEIYAATNGGLDVILGYYPQAEKCVNNGKKFKARGSEKTASATIKRLPDGVYVVTDFGGDSKPRNAIAVVMYEENCDFKTAIEIISRDYNILPNEIAKELFKPEVIKRDAEPEEEEGTFIVELNDSFTEGDLKTLFSKNIIEYYEKTYKDASWSSLEKIAKTYNFHSVKSFGWIKNRTLTLTVSNDHYPIFIIDEGKFKKIYQPKHIDKAKRFLYAGEKEKDFIHGYKQLIKKYEDLNTKPSQEEFDENGEPKTITVIKLDECIICSGGSDALNVAALGYAVLWLNSETAKLNKVQWLNLDKMCNKVMYLPDIDLTGKSAAHELSMEYLDLFTIELPEALSEKRDIRGNPCKDVRDYFNHYKKYDFDELVKSALPYRFWDMEPQYNKKGDFKGFGYTFNNVHAYNFLQKNGFWRYQSENTKEGYIFIQIVGNVVSEVQGNDIKNFIHKFLEERKMDVKLRNTFYKSTQLSDASLSNLKINNNIDFRDYDKDSQFMFFENKTWEIKADGIYEHKPGAIKRYVWQEEVIKIRIKPLEPSFNVKQLDNGDLDIDVKRTDCLFLKYLINTSRIHWRKELEDVLDQKDAEYQIKYRRENQFNIAGPLLDEALISEQKQHLINKIYALGYLLHRYKDKSRTWAVYAMDAKLSDQGESHGGSGKSICFGAPTYLMRSLTLEGRNNKLTENQFLYENVSEHTDYVLVDDCHEYIRFDFFYSSITMNMTVNPKHGKQFTIPFEKSPKFAFTSNYPLRDTSPSTLRRILFCVFSDYYHYNSSYEYREERKPIDEFGKNLFQDFNDGDWNEFLNTIALCIKTYLAFDKVDPPMDNVQRRNYKAIMGDGFHAWADVYFSKERNTLDDFVIRKIAFENFLKETNAKGVTPQTFMKKIKAWCDYNAMELNPKIYQNAAGRIIRKDSSDESVEMIYINSKSVEPNKTLNF